MRPLSSVSSWLAVISGAAAFVMMGVICTDVVMRYLGSAVPGAGPVVTHYLMVLVAFFSVPKAEDKDSMIVVNILSSVLGPRGDRVLQILAGTVVVLIYAALAQATWLEAINRFHGGAYVVSVKQVVPVWPSYFFVPIAYGLAGLIVLLRVVRVARPAATA